MRFGVIALTLLLILAIALITFMAAVLVLVGLFEAPWPILLGILVVGLVFIQQASLKSTAEDPPEALDAAKSATRKKSTRAGAAGGQAKDKPSVASIADSEPDSDWVYRGVHYQHLEAGPVAATGGDRPSGLPSHPKVDASDGENVSGTYRGRRWQHPVSPPSESPPPPASLTYRGIKLPKSSPPAAEEQQG